jgi:hypothetical protein
MAIKIWTYWNDSPVKLAIDEREIRLETGGAHEEGWSRESETFWREGDFIYRDCESEGRDCDGRSSSRTLLRCHVSQIAMRGVPLDDARGLRFPEWEPVTRSQRDYNAEAAGY